MPARVLVAGSVLASLFAGCASSHERGGGAGDGAVVPSDDGGGFHPVDAGWRPGLDSGVLRLDAGPPPPPLRDAGPPGDRAGDVWEGYIESYAFPSGSDHVRVVFDSASGDGARTGVVIFGAGTPPPPATDPNVGYPPGVSMPDRFGSPSISEGFEYPIVDGSVTGARVQLTVRLGSLWERWCELQTPIPQTASVTWFSCLPNTGGGYGPSGCYYNDPTSGDPVPVDCGKYALCSMWMVCDCEPAGCVAGSVGEIAFDFHVVADAGDGSVTIRDLHNVHLTRAP